MTTADLALEILVEYQEERDEMWVSATLRKHEEGSDTSRGAPIALSDGDRLRIREVSSEADLSPNMDFDSPDGIEVVFTNPELPARYRVELIRDDGRSMAAESVVDVPGVLFTTGPRADSSYRLEDEVSFSWAVVDSAGLEVSAAPASGVDAVVSCGSEVDYVTLDFVGEDVAGGARGGTLPAAGFLAGDAEGRLPCEIDARLIDSANVGDRTLDLITLPADFSIDPRLANARAPGLYEVSVSAVPRSTAIELRE